MAEDIYGLTRSDVTVLQQLISSWKAGELGRPLQPSRRPLPPAVTIYAAYTSTGGIPARSSTIAGSTTVSLVTISSSGLIETTTETVTAYNLADVAVQGEVYIQLKREALTGRLLVDFEPCT